MKKVNKLILENYFWWSRVPFGHATFELTSRNQKRNKTKSVLKFIGGWASTFIPVSRSFLPTGFPPSIVHVFVLFYFNGTDNFLSTVPVVLTITGKLISTDQVQCRILLLLLLLAKVDTSIFFALSIFMMEVTQFIRYNSLVKRIHCIKRRKRDFISKIILKLALYRLCTQNGPVRIVYFWKVYNVYQCTLQSRETLGFSYMINVNVNSQC